MSSGEVLPSITSSVTTHSRISRWEGISYITSSITSSRMERRPRAPVFCLNALRATATTAFSVNFNFTFSKARSFSYCLRSAFLGSVRMRMSDFSSSSSSVATTGKRPTNSGSART